MKKYNILKFILISTCLCLAFTFSAFSKGWVNDGGDNWQYVESDGMYAVSVIKSSGDDKYYIDETGFMVRDYLLEDYNDSVYYFDDSGKMVKNTWVAVDPMQVYNAMDNAPTIYLYYFGNNGKAYKADNGIIRKTIDGKKYLFNDNGQMLSGWINEDGERYDERDSEDDPFMGYCYYAGDETDGVLREGWEAYEDGSVQDEYYLKPTLWFYFNTRDNKKLQSTSTTEALRKKINNRFYAFDINGVMIQGWDTDTLDPNNNVSTLVTKNYFSEAENDLGSMVKREWIFAVPSRKQNGDDHDQEIERWFYSLGSGEMVKKEMKRINGDFYAFDKNGIMKKGLCVFDKQTREYVDCVDIEKTEGKDFIISRHYISMDQTTADTFSVFDDEKHVMYYFVDQDDDPNFGKRTLKVVDVAFGDDDYSFGSNNAGEYEGLRDRKKLFQAGIRLKADKTLGYGMVFMGYASTSEATRPVTKPKYYNSTNPYAKPDYNHDKVLSDYMVLRNSADYKTYNAYPIFYVVDPAGYRINKSNKVVKDKSGNYWAIGNDYTLIGIYEVPIRHRNGKWQFRSDKIVGNSKSKLYWIDFGELDMYKKTCYAHKDNLGDYALSLDDTYAVNFRFADK